MLNPEIVKQLMIALELTGTTLSKTAAETMAEDLSQHPVAHVLPALERCRKELHGRRLTTADVLERLDDGRPGPEEAWAMISKANDSDTTVWTDEICEAWAAARFVLDDRVAGRQAFLEVYRDRIAIARGHARPVRWQVYLGHDPERRAGVVVDAVNRGLIAPEQARAVLPPHEWLPEWHAGRALPAAQAEIVTRADVAAMVTNLSEQLKADRRSRSLPAAEEGSLREALETRWRETDEGA